MVFQTWNLCNEMQNPNHQTNWLDVTEVLRCETYSDHIRVFYKYTNLTILASNALLSGNKKFQEQKSYLQCDVIQSLTTVNVPFRFLPFWIPIKFNEFDEVLFPTRVIIR